MKGVASMVVEAIKRYPLLVIFMLVLLLVMIFAIVYYRMSKKYEKSQIELKESLLAATTLNRCIHALTYHSEIDDAINDLLCLITEFFQGDRAYIFQIDYEQNTTSNLFEYTEEGATSYNIRQATIFLKKLVEIQIIIPYYKFNIDIRKLFLDVWCISFI